MKWTREDGYVISDDATAIDLDAVHAFLTQSYWSPGISREVVARAAANSLTFSLRAPEGDGAGPGSPAGAQAGFARAVTDRATYAYLADVYVLDEHRGRGLGKWLVQTVMEHPDLQGLRRWALATADAHGLYARFGFAAPEQPEMHMFRERDARGTGGPAPGSP